MIEVEHLTKSYGRGDHAVTVLDGLSFTVAPGEIFAVVGPSGAGKSTLANCLNLLERPTSGKVIVNQRDLAGLNARDLRNARRRIGTVFQSSSLLARRTVAGNVALPLDYLGVTKGETRSRVDELLDRVGLADKAKLYPHQLSGGQRQRVGIARALALRPSVLLSDEATSGLDPQSTEAFLSLLRDVRDELDLAVVFITHEMDTIVKVADTVARLDSGKFVEHGRLIDLLTNPHSELGRALRPHGNPALPDDGTVSIEVTYRTSSVPADWITRLGTDSGIPVSILAASVQAVGHVTVGELVVSVPASDAGRFVADAAAYGLSAQVRGTDAPRELVAS